MYIHYFQWQHLLCVLNSNCLNCPFEIRTQLPLSSSGRCSHNPFHFFHNMGVGILLRGEPSQENSSSIQEKQSLMEHNIAKKYC